MLPVILYYEVSQLILPSFPYFYLGFTEFYFIYTNKVRKEQCGRVIKPVIKNKQIRRPTRNT